MTSYAGFYREMVENRWEKKIKWPVGYSRLKSDRKEHLSRSYDFYCTRAAPGREQCAVDTDWKAIMLKSRKTLSMIQNGCECSLPKTHENLMTKLQETGKIL